MTTFSEICFQKYGCFKKENMENKRLIKEFKAFQSKPISNCGIAPREENFRLWDCVIQVKLESEGELIEFPLHFLTEFPPEYPNKAPNVGFSTTFPYENGASYVVKDSEKALDGKFVICLDLLGNFANVHTEWSAEKGSGWSPAYDISSLLVVLQSVVQESFVGSSRREIEVTNKKINWINLTSFFTGDQLSMPQICQDSLCTTCF